MRSMDIRRRILPAALAAAALSLLPGQCRAGGQLEKVRDLADRPRLGGAAFRLHAPEETGVDHVLPIDTSHRLKRLYTSAYACGGVGIADFDGDGRLDLFFASGPGPNRLYLQAGPWRFEEGTEAAGVDGGGSWSAGVAVVDIDADGDPDIYVCNYESPNQLFVNLGGGRFAERARDFGLDLSGAWLMAGFADYDRDGDLDVHLLGHRFYREGGRPEEAPSLIKDGRPVILPEYERYYRVDARGGGRYEVNNCGAADMLLRNDGRPGAPRYSDVTVEAGIEPGRWQGNSALWFDYDRDGWPDLYVASDFEDPDRLYRNNRNGTFSDVTRQALAHTTWFSMGTDIADIDNDGWIDLLSLDMAGTSHYKSKTTMGAMGASRHFMLTADPPQHMRNCLYRNTGTGRFVDVAFMAGLAYSDWSWTAKFADFDEDGLADLFVSNGVTRSFNDSDHPLDISRLVGGTEWDLYESLPPRRERNLAFRNLGDLAFEETSRSWGLDLDSMSYGAAAGDLDGDGDLDLVVANLEDEPFLHENLVSGRSRLALELVGAGFNPGALGATVTVRSALGLQTRQAHPSRGFLSSDAPAIHFGLGEESRAAEIAVLWPDGSRDSWTDVPANALWRIRQGGEGSRPAPPAPPVRTLYHASRALPPWRHWEEPFDDFKLQPLLPSRLSRLGPGLASADIDGDGDIDHFVGNGVGQPGRLLVLQEGGRYQARAFPHHPGREDMGALFLDADRDGDPDLYVASGSNEFPPGDPRYLDRLYLNDGSGGFRPAPEGALPGDRFSSGPVAAADFDRDGDLDLVVGGRSLPGRFPQAASSRLYRNEGRPGAPAFADATREAAPMLEEAGLVTGALWSDADGDGWPDLLLSLEWGPVRLLLNRKGKLEEATRASGLAARQGWWTGIQGGDLDRDGDIDYVATNFGLNTKYKASAEAPEVLYYGRFGGQQEPRIIEACLEDGKLFPHRGFSCSSSAIPSLGPRLGSYHRFALATLPELYSEERLARADRYSADTLESGVWINDGSARFRWSPLPRAAQTAPSFGSALVDADADGRLDLYLVQNFFGPQIETRPMDGGLSLLLEGDGTGRFDPVPARRSGLIAPGDSKSLVVLDANQDLRPDFLVGVNDAPLLLFERDGGQEGRWISVRLEGPPGNPTGVGARLALLTDPPQIREIAAGGGYLSQSPAQAWFARPPDGTSLEVRWPDGLVRIHPLPPGRDRIVLSRP